MLSMGTGVTVVEENNLTVVEGSSADAFLTCADDATRIVEACMSARTRAALLYPANLPPAFFDLSSGEVGAILQKLANYGVRLAVVCPPGSVLFSSRFEEMLAEERGRRRFGVFSTRREAREWLAT